MATRKCRTCQAKLRVEDTHALCWEHIGRSHFCDKCEELAPFGRYKDYQQFLANCWLEKDEQEGVGEMPRLTPRPGGPAEEGEIVEPLRKTSQSASRTSHHGGAHGEDAAVSDKEENGDLGHKSPQASGSLGSGRSSGGPSIELPTVWSKVKSLERGFEGLRSEMKSGLLSFKEEMKKFFSDTFSPRREGNDDVSVMETPTQGGVDDVEDVEEGSEEEEDDSLVEFKRRLSRIDSQVKTTPPVSVPSLTTTTTVSQGASQQPVVIHLFQDKDKDEKKRKEDEVEERNNDEDSLSLRDLVKSQLGKDDYKPYMSDQVCRDLTAEGPVLTNTAAQWARVCLDESVPFKAHFHESMWTHVVLTDDSLYKTTMVPKMVNQADSSGVKADIRQPRVPVSEVECSAWRKQVNEVLTSSSSTQNLSLVTQAIKNGYQFVDKDFKRLGMDPNVDVYVKEVCSMMGKKEPKFDKQSMAYKTLSSTNTMFRIITFIRMALETGKNLHESSVGSDDGSILPMFFKVMEKASEDLRLVTARLHGLSLRKVRGQVLEGSPFEKGDREKLVRATCLPSQYLFAGRLPDGEGFRDKDAQVARAKQEVERLERRKRFASNRPQGPSAKKPRFDQPSRGKYQSGYGSRQGGNNNRQFQDNRDKREPFRPSWRGGDRGGRGRGRGSANSNARK